MSKLHWPIVLLLLLALIGLPAWYVYAGKGALGIPGSEVKALRNAQNRSVAGGGVRLGK